MFERRDAPFPARREADSHPPFCAPWVLLRFTISAFIPAPTDDWHTDDWHSRLVMTPSAALNGGMRRIVTPTPWALAAYMLIRNARGRVLMLRRSQTSAHFPGCWELPGGKPAPGEHFARTAELEVFEETNLDVVADGVAGAVESSVPGLRVAILILEGRSTQTHVTLSPEHDSHAWLPLARIGSLKLRTGFDTFFAQYQGQGRRPRKKSPRSRRANSKS